MDSIILHNSRITVALSRDGNRLLAQSVTNLATGFNWVASGTPLGPSLSQGGDPADGMETSFTLAGQPLLKTASDAEHLFVAWTRPDGLTLDWTLTSFPGVSVVAFGASLRNSGEELLTTPPSFGPLSIRLRDGTAPYKVHWVTRYDYRKHEATLDRAFTLRGGEWNRPDSAGWFVLENTHAQEILFVGIEWESYWQMSLERQDSQVLLHYTLEHVRHDLPPNATLAAPRVFLGVSHGDLDDALRDLHDYLRMYVMAPKLPHTPWVAYDIWGTEAEGVEEGILAEIPFAADLGVELFYVDASWYDGSCKNGSGDWFTGVGNWQQEDRVKYPRGLASLSHQVHQAGMRFGLWFCPQM
ncbi:MAG: alpha-galactosidase, partial [Candidatus Latescibacteria bacterium]|nr:alpha-galactosidase [Candidatus Latescibacterota bacterium]